MIVELASHIEKQGDVLPITYGRFAELAIRGTELNLSLDDAWTIAKNKTTRKGHTMSDLGATSLEEAKAFAQLYTFSFVNLLKDNRKDHPLIDNLKAAVERKRKELAGVSQG